MRIGYDQNVDALSIKFNDKPYTRSLEVIEGVMIDVTAAGEIIAIEILYATAREIDPYEIVYRYSQLPAQTAAET